MKETFNKNTGLWRSDNRLIITVNYIKPIVDYTKQHDIFQLTKRARKAQYLLILVILRVTMVALHLFEKNGRGSKEIIEENEKAFRRL